MPLFNMRNQLTLEKKTTTGEGFGIGRTSWLLAGSCESWNEVLSSSMISSFPRWRLAVTVCGCQEQTHPRLATTGHWMALDGSGTGTGYGTGECNDRDLDWTRTPDSPGLVPGWLAGWLGEACDGVGCRIPEERETRRNVDGERGAICKEMRGLWVRMMAGVRYYFEMEHVFRLCLRWGGGEIGVRDKSTKPKTSCLSILAP
ncbi:hypothetical protein QBC45DRAFT_410514 [Copromyces sp. CBS 386.78]|nr:hypothetical protein QBC45DRAFT_410514 [Copromyces sp. CBS 386.78]